MEGEPELNASTSELLERHDATVADGVARVRALPDQKLAQPLSFLGVSNFPAAAYLGFLHNHSIHHCGQLSI
jgi:hypothetical protein